MGPPPAIRASFCNRRGGVAARKAERKRRRPDDQRLARSGQRLINAGRRKHGSRMTHFTTRSRVAAAALLALAASVAIAAEPKGDNRASVFQGLLDCKAKTDDAARLACYDA